MHATVGEERFVNPPPSMKRSRSLWPREHGAYVQLLVPLVTALACHLPTVVALLLALASGLAFLANEPLLVVLGHRGPRMQAHDGARARRRLAMLAALAIATGGAALALADRETLLMGALVAPAAVAVTILATRGLEHSLAGQLLAAIALAGLAAPVAVASGVLPATAIAIWIAWSAGFACTVIAVHRVIARHRKPASALDILAVLAIGTIVVGGVLVTSSIVPVPFGALALGLVARPPRATRLRAIGVVVTVVAALAGAYLAIILA